MKETWRLLRTKPVPKRMPFGYVQRVRDTPLRLWGVYSVNSQDTPLHVSFTYYGADKWRYDCMILGIVNDIFGELE